MAGTSVGQIGLDLVVNQNGFERQMKGIQNLAKKAGAALAAAFAVKKIVDFGAQCVQLGSDLQEVQNVVDVTFPRMTKQVNEFAQNAAMSFGLSETMAKRFTGTFGAMAKAFGFNERAAYEMSTALTGLAGDVASFYNISQDEAYTKLKSVFTGETESLKDLGVVMTQAALDQYALANGFGKTTQAMSEAEKVALRYKFVQDQLSLASGDFIRTSDSWANQVRMLKLQFDSLKATIGQGLINVLTPVLKVINQIISKLMSLANAFKAFTEMITGKKSGGGASVAAAGMEAIAGSAAQAGAAIGGAGGAAKKAAKDMKGLLKTDELNVLPDRSAGAGGGGAGGGYSPDEFDMGEIDTSAIDEMDSKYQGLVDKMKELAALFKTGFQVGFGDASVLDSIKTSIEGIKNSLKGIFTDPEVANAADKFARQFTYNLGKMAGAITSIGATIADNLLGGINSYLEQNSPRIKNFLISMFDIGSDISAIAGRFSEAIAVIFSAFRSDAAKQITADMIGIFAESFMGVLELTGRLGRDILDLITAPFIKNKDLIRQSLEDTFAAVEPIVSEFKSIVDEVFDKLKVTYDGSIKPMFESFKQGFAEIVEKLLEAYNQYILPVIQEMGEKFKEFHDRYLSPLIDKFLDFTGKVAEIITIIWENFLKPFVLWFIDTMGPIIGNTLSNLSNLFFEWMGKITEVLGYIINALSGLLDFIIGIFTGDWQRAWEGIKTFFESIWNAILEFGTLIWTTIKDTFISIMTAAVDIVKAIFSGLKDFASVIWEAMKSAAQAAWTFIKDTISSLVTGAVELVKALFTGLKDFLSVIWEAIKSTASNVWNGIKETVTRLAGNLKDNAVNAFNALRDGIGNALSTLTGVVSNGFQGAIRFITSLPSKALQWGKDFIGGLVDGIKSKIGAIKDAVSEAASAAAEYLHFSRPDTGPLHEYEKWMPDFIGGLAKGIRGNLYQIKDAVSELSYDMIPQQPQLDMVKRGNPSSKSELRGQADDFSLEELVSQIKIALADTVKMAAGLIPQQSRFAADTGDIIIPIYLDGGVLDEVVITAQQRKALRSGGR